MEAKKIDDIAKYLDQFSRYVEKLEKIGNKETNINFFATTKVSSGIKPHNLLRLMGRFSFLCFENRTPRGPYLSRVFPVNYQVKNEFCSGWKQFFESELVQKCPLHIVLPSYSSTFWNY